MSGSYRDITPYPICVGTPSSYILVTWPNFDPSQPDIGLPLADLGASIRLAPKLGARTTTELAMLAENARAAIVSTDPFDKSVFAAASRLEVVSRVGIGTDSIDLEAATEAGVVVTITPGANEETVADHTLALMLAALRRIVEHDSSIRRGEWPRGGVLTGSDLHGRTIGIIGLGTIGRAVITRLRGFRVILLGYDPAVQVPDVEPVTLDELLERSDVVSVHVPLLPSTVDMIGTRELKMIRPGAVLVNTSRGGVVNEEALLESLDSGRLRAAALDVFREEPPTAPTAQRLFGMPNVVLTPHVGGLTIDSINRMLSAASRAVVDVLTGRVPDSVVNPEVFSHPRFSSGRPTSG